MIVEPGTVARAVPGFFIRVPLQLTSQVRTADRNRITGAFFIPVYTHLLTVNAHDPSLPRMDGQFCLLRHPKKAAANPFAGLASLTEKRQQSGRGKPLRGKYGGIGSVSMDDLL